MKLFRCSRVPAARRAEDEDFQVGFEASGPAVCGDVQGVGWTNEGFSDIGFRA